MTALGMLKTGDLYFVRSRGFVGSAIRLFTRRVGESRTKVNHVGIVGADGNVIEALSSGVVSRPFGRALEDRIGDEIAIYRPRNLSKADLHRVAWEAEQHVGKPYGHLKVVAQALDGLLFGAHLFRRLARLERYPICSWLVADAYRAAGYDFGVPVEAASPDDVWDFCLKNPDKYEAICPLSPVVP